MHLKADLNELGARYLNLVVRVIQECPTVSLDVFGIRNQQMVYLFGRLSDIQRERVLEHTHAIFGDGCETALRDALAQPLDEATVGNCGLPQAFLAEASELQFDMLACLREEARRDSANAGVVFGIRDMQIIEAVRDCTTSRLHRMSASNLFLRMTPAPSFYLLVQMVVADTNNPSRLGIAGLGVLAYAGATP
ncbi:MAG: hypothetical protein BGO50_01605 [Rhodanobacter sp. 67-28]|nr:MAG: hypothetical protein ABS98_07110 [Xanthomonadaceae bacterium SCN 69-48]OJW42456.1 MAG: hypothetical protein BGO50_01605 [Rhodanobacter sp. 67-28]